MNNGQSVDVFKLFTSVIF